MSDKKITAEELDKFLIQEKENSLEISHPDFKINSIVDKKFITYNYIKSLQSENERLRNALESVSEWESFGNHVDDRVVKIINQALNK